MGGIPSKLVNVTKPTDSPAPDIERSSSKKVPVRTKTKSVNNANNKFVVVWVDSHVQDNDVLYRNSLARLQRISISINTFINVNDCTEFLRKMQENQVLMIIADSLIKEIWPRIQSMSQIHSIYILSEDGAMKEYPKQEYPKIKGVFDQFDPVYSSLKRDTRQEREDILVMSIIPSLNYTNHDLKGLNQLFLYWLLVREIILQMKYENQAHQRLAAFCRRHYSEKSEELKVIDEFEETYNDHPPSWWYTRDCFISVMLNRALQTQDIEVIIQMGSFIQDLHRQLDKSQTTSDMPNVFYRTKNLFIEDLEKMKNSGGNLLSFNNFLIAETDYEICLEEARRARVNSHAIGLLFRIEIQFDSRSTPFSLLKNISYSHDEDQSVLFSIHSVFRIGQMKQIEERVWQVILILIDIDDKQITRLMELIRDETKHSIEWNKLAKLMISIHDVDQAREIYLVLLQLLTENDSLKMAHIYNELGLISDQMGDYTLALQYYQKGIELRQKCLPPNHRLLGIAYNNIGEAQRELGEYHNALSSHKKTLSIKQKTLPSNHLSFATTYNNLGLANESLGDFPTALVFYQKAIEIKRKVLSPTHKDLAITYNNIGELQREMGNYAVALNYFDKVLQIRLNSASSSSPFDSNLAITYNNIGLIHREMGDFTQAILYFEKSLAVKEKTFASHHPSLAVTYNNIGDINQQMGEFSQALLSYKKALEIQERAFSVNHPELATTYNNIGVAHQSLGNYPTALAFYQKALKIRLKSLPNTHPCLGTSYSNIGYLNQTTGDYQTALEYYQKTQKLQEKSLRPNHPSLATTYNNIADVHRKLGNDQMALVLYKKSLEIKKKSLTPHHPSLVVTYNNIGVIHQSMKEYSSALEYYKQTLEIQQKVLSSTHPDLAAVYTNIGVAHQSMNEYSIALGNYQKALKIQEKSLPTNHPDVSMTLNAMATVYVSMGELTKGLDYEQRAVDIASQTLTSDHPLLKTFRNYLERIEVRIKSMENT